MDQIFPTQNRNDDPLSATTSTLSDDLRRYLLLLLNWSWLFIIFGLVAGAYGYWDSSRKTPVYRASATVLINESRNLNEYANILASERLAQTYSKLMVQLPVLEGVVEQLGLTISPASLKGRVSVSVQENTQLMVISVEDTDPVRAADIANSIGIVFTEQNQEFQASRYQDSKTNLLAQQAQVNQQIEETGTALLSLGSIVTNELGVEELVYTPEEQRVRDRLETNLALYRQIYANLVQSYEQVRLAEIQNTSNVILVEPATPPGGPIRPNVSRDTMLAVVVGLLLAAGIVLMIELLNDTVKGPDDITRLLGLPVLGLVARIDDEADNEAPITVVAPRSPVSEAFRALRTNIQYTSVDKPLRRIMVTSPSPRDGKSTISTNLGVVLAQSGRRVYLIDADMRRPTLHKRIKMSNRTGLSQLFVEPAENLSDGPGALPGTSFPSVASVARETKIPNLQMITTGGLPPNPAELVGSGRMAAILTEAEQNADILILDTPPVMAVTDAAVLAGQVDGVLLVIRPGETRIGAARQAVEQLRRSNANLLGVVLNDVDNKRNRYYYYYRGYYAYAYNYYYGDSGKRGKRAGRHPKAAPPVTAEE